MSVLNGRLTSSRSIVNIESSSNSDLEFDVSSLGNVGKRVSFKNNSGETVLSLLATDALVGGEFVQAASYEASTASQGISKSSNDSFTLTDPCVKAISQNGNDLQWVYTADENGLEATAGLLGVFDKYTKSEVDGLISGIESDIITNTSDIYNLTSNSYSKSEVDTLVNSGSVDLTTIEADIIQNASSISTNTSDISNLTSNIATISSSVGTNTSNISNLDTLTQTSFYNANFNEEADKLKLFSHDGQMNAITFPYAKTSVLADYYLKTSVDSLITSLQSQIDILNRTKNFIRADRIAAKDSARGFTFTDESDGTVTIGQSISWAPVGSSVNMGGNSEIIYGLKPVTHNGTLSFTFTTSNSESNMGVHFGLCSVDPTTLSRWNDWRLNDMTRLQNHSVDFPMWRKNQHVPPNHVASNSYHDNTAHNWAFFTDTTAVVTTNVTITIDGDVVTYHSSSIDETVTESTTHTGNWWILGSISPVTTISNVKFEGEFHNSLA